MSARAYQEAVRASEPVKFFLFSEPIGARSILDSVSGDTLPGLGQKSVPELGVTDPWGTTFATRLKWASGDENGWGGVIQPFAVNRDFTIEFWQRVPSAAAGQTAEQAVWLWASNIGQGTADWVAQCRPCSKNVTPAYETFCIRLNQGGWRLSHPNSVVGLPDDTWHHYAYVFMAPRDTAGGGLVFAFVDGVEVGTRGAFAGSPPVSPNPATVLGIGTRANAAGGFGWGMNGDIAGMAFFDRVLSPTEIAGHHGAQDPATGCIRRAWLELGTLRLDLENKEAGWICTQLDLGWPEVREVTDNRPDTDGIDDRTRYFGSRAITADISTTPYAESIDAVASQFGRFMSPRSRPELHYVLDRPGTPERVLTVRGSEYGWPIVGGSKRDIHLAWVAADPIARSVDENVATAWCGSDSPGGGRRYDLTYDRSYGLEGGGEKMDAEIVVEGDVTVAPVFRIYGPATKPSFYVNVIQNGAVVEEQRFAFAAGFVVAAGESVEIDSARHTCIRNGVSVIGSVDWMHSTWPMAPPTPLESVMGMEATSTSYLTQITATWQDGWLS